MMHVTMAELNKHANSIINQAHSSGESITVLKHGKPIAQILPLHDESQKDHALSYLTTLEATPIERSIDSVIEAGRQRGI